MKQIVITDETHKRLRLYAVNSGKTIHEVSQEAVESYLKRKEKQNGKA
jgi:predicted DNA-binding protein